MIYPPAKRDPFIMFVCWCVLIAFVTCLFAIGRCEWHIANMKLDDIQTLNR